MPLRPGRRSTRRSRSSRVKWQKMAVGASTVPPSRITSQTATSKRTVVADQHARHFGTELREEDLVPGAKRASARQVSKLESDCRTHLAGHLWRARKHEIPLS